ncbi:MAG: hypothetical protein ACOX8Q_08905 [Christensenellales bacterium]|jgi:hypothetical protein
MRKFSVKISVVCLCLALSVAILAGCGSVSLSKPTPLADVPTYPVTGKCDIVVNGDTITVLGQTDLMNGVFLNISVVAQNGMTVDSVTITKNGDQVSQDFKITDKYENVDSIIGYITCAPTLYGNQPENVDKIYGDNFEYIEATKDNSVWNSDGVIVLFASDMTELPK